MMLSTRRVKIVSTLGPATQGKSLIEKAIRAGTNVARLNFSHGTHEDHLANIKAIRELSVELRAPVTVLQDLQGPKTMESVLGKPGLIPSDFPELGMSVKKGDRILLDDGLLELVVLSSAKELVQCEVLYGGFLKDRKGLNCPGATLAVESLTKKDLADLEFGIKHEVDYVALSFVRFPNDIRKVRDILNQKKSNARICAKIEMLEAIENLEEIAMLSDAVMVARGDLAVEIGQKRLPGVQKRIIKLCNKLNKPVITATQMLDSMIENPRPTRAEITDVANAVIDGSDALMLSAETASGAYPFKAIETMHDIICEAEIGLETYYKHEDQSPFMGVPESIGASASLSAQRLDAKVIVCLTSSGKTANIIAGFRPRAKLVAATDEVGVLNKLEIIWGLQTIVIDDYKTMHDVVTQVERLLLQYKIASPGDKVILTLGQPVADRAKTNSLFVHTLGKNVYREINDADMPLRCRVIEPTS
jgi:pyruvate kinase